MASSFAVYIGDRPAGGGGGSIATSAASSVTLAAPSGSSSDITFTFSTAHQVGQFPNGDYFVLPNSVGGTVSVSAMTPTYTTGRNGYMVNPLATKWNVGQSFDDRGGSDSTFSAPSSLPLALSANQSLVKVASMATQTSYSWIQHAAVLTCLASAPATGTMRPAAFGTNKRLISSSNITSGLFPNLSATPVPTRLSMTSARARCVPFRCAWHPGPSWGYYRSSADAVAEGKTWGGDFMKNDIELLCSMCLSHLTGAEKVELAIAFAQHGIDTWGAANPAAGGGAGYLRGGGGNGAGHLVQLAFAAWVTDDTVLKAFLSGASEATWNPAGSQADIGFAEMLFWETACFYRNSAGKGSVALWGKKWEPWNGENDAAYWSDFNVPGGGVPNATLRDPYEYIDGGPVPGDSYQGNTSHQVMGLSALFDRAPGFKAVWPSLVDNANVLADYGRRWRTLGAWTSPDPAAPKSGTYGVNYGAASPGVPITGSGRAISLHGTATAGGNRTTQTTADFVATYGL